MQAAEILHRVHELGVELEVDHGALIAKPASRLTDDLRQAIRSHKTDLLAALVAGQHGLMLADLREAAGPDWPEVERDQVLLETLAHAVQIRRMRERGVVPPEYTAVTDCAGCGPVPIFPGCPPKVDGCPWCFNRAKGLSVPRANSSNEHAQEASRANP